MTGSSVGAAFFDEFIDDYFAECEEHLATVRRVLLALEERPGAAPEAAQLSDLLRALHTLKGLSGMVGLSAAEEIAHAMEDGVRALPAGQAPPPVLLETLFTGERTLEACIAARRNHATPPSPGPFVDRVRDVVRIVSPAAGDPVARADATHALQRLGSATYSFEFAPSAELASRGVGVELVRQRLGTIGEIVSTTPRVRAGGGVVFQFAVRLRGDASPDERWRTDGLTWEPQPGDAAASVGIVVHETQSAPATTANISASNVVRVDLSRLDDLMRMVGELVVSRARLGEVLARTGHALPAAVLDDLNEATEVIERQLRTIREGVMRVRLVRVHEVFERMRFATRDIARETHKTIHIEFTGEDTEIDKLVVDRMLEPLLHLVRNAASHGIESRADRLDAGKDPDGTIWLRARAAGDRILLEVEDDGAGIDVPAVVRRAAALGLIQSEHSLAPDALLDIICSPGFSTRSSADMTSGRGVGMTVVRSTIRALGGELFIDSAVGRGTRFTIELPLTLMITDALILEVGDQAMAIPQVSLREIVVLEPASVTRFENNDVLSYRGGVVPLVHLGALFRLSSRPGAARHVLIVGSDGHLTGLVVDRVLGLREIVVHPVPDPIVAVPGIAGATELADGRVSLILDAGALVRGSRESTVRAAGDAVVVASRALPLLGA
jgi:two-component system chemotaxis sensor kinase CheA